MIKNFLFDFDGVILDSMHVRDHGFRLIFSEFDPDLVEKLIQFHRENGGLSRFVKIRYFYEKLLKCEISNEKVDDYSHRFSEIMRVSLADKRLLIPDAIHFIEKKATHFNFHIVSGSEQNELRFLCKKLGITPFFKSVLGSPIAKKTLVKTIITEHEYGETETVLVGDSRNDYEAAQSNQIAFWGYNNPSLRDISSVYVDSFDSLEAEDDNG